MASTRPRGGAPAGLALASLTAGFMIAQQVAAKATRDALFLSQFDVTNLPAIWIASAVLSLAVVLVVSRALAVQDPARLTPRLFAASGVLLMIECLVCLGAPRVGAVVVYLHVAVFGAIAISGFWAVLNELFDPRTAKRGIGRITAGGTLGGLLGGALANRLAPHLPLALLLPVLGSLHLICAVLVAALPRSGGRPRRRTAARTTETTGFLPGLRVIEGTSYLRQLGALVLVTTVGAALIDYVFKSYAAASRPNGAELLRFFSVFYTSVGIATFLAQALASRPLLERFGLARTASLLPATMAAGAASVLVAPGGLAISIVRGAEAVVRGSLFVSSYELFYTPLPAARKRSAKPILDVGIERVGDALGGASVQAVLWLAPAGASYVLLGGALAAGLAAIGITRMLHSGYILALRGSLRERAVELSLDEVEDETTRTVFLQSIPGLDRAQILPSRSRIERRPAEAAKPSTAPPADPLVAALAELRSADPRRVRKALAGAGPLDPAWVAHVIPLLAWDEVAEDAIRALRTIAASRTGQLLDALLDPEEEDTIRRRIPRVLIAAPAQRTLDGLLEALSDPRFEVRYQAARAMRRILGQTEGLRVESARIFDAVLREVEVGRPVWESRRLLDQSLEGEDVAVFDELVRTRSHRSLEHVFGLLALALPEEPLRLAYRGLYTDDEKLRGTALEYLESVLPPAIRAGLWPYLEDRRREKTQRPTEEALAELLRSNVSIQINLAELQKRTGK